MRLPICGGSWNNTSNAGVFNVNLNNPRSNSNSNIGFRSALLSYARGWMIYESPDSARG
nr:MAG TPA: TREPONEMA DENTICOLA VARIABLE PROTEIN 1 FUNCTION, PERIODONTAL DISEASE [Caudoviricetes sp.]